MKCPYCSCIEDKVLDSRMISGNTSIRRRRECLNCNRRFNTYETIEEMPVMVIKKNGGRETFSRKKIKDGITKACEKRPISLDQIDSLVDTVQERIEKLQQREIESTVVGEMVMELLQALDEVAYVRFASVYRQFKDVSQFMEELKGLLKK
jgi:transcriptional repressor NrdR